MKRASIGRVIVFMLLSTRFEAFCLAGGIVGKVLDPATGKGVRRITVRAFQQGRSVAIEVSTENDGSYTFSDLREGAYAVCIGAGENYRPVSVGVVEVEGGDISQVNLNVRSSVVIEGDSWVRGYPSFSQSFRATGLGVSAVRIRAYGPRRKVRIQVVAGDGPGGRAVGPARITEKVGGEGTTVVGWSGAEVPTTPGEMYTVVMSAMPGETWIPGVAGRGDVYPSGSAWFGGSGRPMTDLGITICQDNDGMRINYGIIGAQRMYRARSAGQTFSALSSSITFASARLATVSGSPTYVRFSIHQGGPGGKQIGPSKAVSPGANCAVAWGSDEVRVTPGEEYYLHIESYSGGHFLVGYADDSYAGGAAVFNGRPARDKDVTATIAGGISDEDFARLVGHRKRKEIVGLVNPSFANGLAGWKRDGVCGAAVGCDAGVVPMWAGKMFGWTNRKMGEGSRTVVYQQVKVRRGGRYSFGGTVYTDHAGGRSSDVKIRLVVLSAGGDAVRDNDKITTSQWYATEGQWRQGSVEFVAESDVITVGFDLEQRFSLDSSSLYVDGAHLECIGD